MIGVLGIWPGSKDFRGILMDGGFQAQMEEDSGSKKSCEGLGAGDLSGESAEDE